MEGNKKRKRNLGVYFEAVMLCCTADPSTRVSCPRGKSATAS